MKRFPKSYTLPIVAFLIIVLIGLTIYAISHSLRTYPLGDNVQLEYIGKRDYGCWVCDSPPSSTYSYGTDMSPEEVAGYFEGLDPHPSIEQKSEYTQISFKNGSLPIVLYYYKNDSEKPSYIKNTSKKYSLKTNMKNYDTLRKSLQDSE